MSFRIGGSKKIGPVRISYGHTFGKKRSKKKSGCYVATCVYGAYDCPQVWVLRRYRDQELDRRWYGKLFIRAYYGISPIVVKLFGNSKWFHSFFRRFLDRKVEHLKKEGFASTPYQDKY